MRIKRLAELKRSEARELPLAGLPETIPMAYYARDKALKINELVRTIHKESYEWYGYTIARLTSPELIIDIGLPGNQQNLQDYTGISSEEIAQFQESLAPDVVINGWIHSHGRLDYQQFSETDAQNQLTVLDYVTSRLKKPVAKREVLIRDLQLLVEGRFRADQLAKGSVALITDAPVREARIMETVYGGFCYAIVIGDQGWHNQEIHYKKRAILTAETIVIKKKAEIDLVNTGRELTSSEITALAEEVEKKIRPVSAPAAETIERM